MLRIRATAALFIAAAPSDIALPLTGFNGVDTPVDDVDAPPGVKMEGRDPSVVKIPAISSPLIWMSRRLS